MAVQSWMNLLNAGAPWQTTAGTALSASASTATISPQATGPQDFILPTQYNGTQWYTGMTLHVQASGTINSGGTTSNLTTFLAVGTSGTLGTTLSTTGALTLGTGSLTGIQWILEAWVRVTATGSSGNTLACAGMMLLPGAVGSNAGTVGTANCTALSLPETAVTLNTYLTAQAIGLRAQLSAAFGLIQCNEFLVFQTA